MAWSPGCPSSLPQTEEEGWCPAVLDRHPSPSPSHLQASYSASQGLHAFTHKVGTDLPCRSGVKLGNNTSNCLARAGHLGAFRAWQSLLLFHSGPVPHTRVDAQQSASATRRCVLEWGLAKRALQPSSLHLVCELPSWQNARIFLSLLSHLPASSLTPGVDTCLRVMISHTEHIPTLNQALYRTD